MWFVLFSSSIYKKNIYAWLISPLKEDCQNVAFRMQRDFVIPSSFTPCLSV